MPRKYVAERGRFSQRLGASMRPGRMPRKYNRTTLPPGGMPARFNEAGADAPEIRFVGLLAARCRGRLQ